MRAFSRHSGNTLIEALVTILFIAFSVIALVRFQHYLAYDNSLAQQRAEATEIGMSKLESLRDFQTLNTTSGYFAYQDIASGTSTVNGINATYSLSWTVASFVNPTYKTIDLTVSWTDRNNGSQSVRLITYVAGVEPSNSAVIM